MNQKTIFMVAAVINFIFGIFVLLIPETFTSYYGNTLSVGGVYFARLWAASVIGLAVMLWLARDAGASQALRAIIVASFVYVLIGLIVAILSQINGMANALGWTTVLLYLIFTLAFGYLMLKKPA